MAFVKDEGWSELSVDSMLTDVGSKVRGLRKEKGLTLAGLSEATGLSPAIVSQIERGLANPSFITLARLSHGLGMPVGKLFPAHTGVKSPVVRKADRRNLKGVVPESSGDAVYELLTPDLNGTIEALWVVSPPGEGPVDGPFEHYGEEVGIVISGKKNVYLGDQKYVLEEGDTITYDSTIPHWYENCYDEPCVAIWVISPPTW